jgi:hypothetical protein
VSDRALLICHAVLGFTAVFAGTHHAAHAVLAMLGRQQARALRRLGWMAAAAVLAQALSGLVLYPAYRVRVRAADFDLHAPGLAQLFDLKEHLSALAIALVVGAALAGRRDEEPRWPLAAVSCTGAAFLWVAAVIGLYVTAVHPL